MLPPCKVSERVIPCKTYCLTRHNSQKGEETFFSQNFIFTISHQHQSKTNELQDLKYSMIQKLSNLIRAKAIGHKNVFLSKDKNL
jgi:hypothetical protein